MKQYRKFMAVVGLSALLAVSATGCTTAKAAELPGPVRSVQVQTLEEKSQPITQHYIGLVDAKDQIEYSFKSSGRLKEILVEDGSNVAKGDLIAKLDIQDLNFQADAARANHAAAKLSITKAKEALDYDTKLRASLRELFNTGSISKDKLDQIELKTQVSEATYNQALTQLKAAQADLNYKTSLLDDANIYAQGDGTVIKVLYDAGELIPQGHPVVVQRSQSQVVKVGIPQKNLNDIKIGSSVTITVDDETANGILTRIDEAPDKSTRTYMAEVTVNETKYHLGAIAEADIEVGQQEGIWVPIQALLSQGEDFVYVKNDDRAFKRTVITQDISGLFVRVTGLEAGEQIVTSGMNNLSDGINIMVDGELN